MNISIIEPVGGHGGMNYYDFGLAEGLSKENCKVTIYTCDETIDPRGVKFSCKKFFLDIYGKKNIVLRSINFFIGFFKSVLDSLVNKVNIFHLHFFHCGYPEWMMVFVIKFTKIKLVITVHDVESFSGKNNFKKSKKILEKADALIVHNKISFLELKEKIGINPGKINIIPHGNYFSCVKERCEKNVARERLNLPKDIPIILFFGQIKEVKGLEIALRAISILKKRGSKFKFVIAGKVWKDDFKKYTSIINNLDINDCVICDIRYIPDDEAAFFYSAADIIVLPYKKIYQSGVLLMAMSFSLPVIASDLPGMLEIVRDGENGYTFESENEENLSDKLYSILGEKNNLNVVSEVALNEMHTKHSWDLIGKKTYLLYQKIINI